MTQTVANAAAKPAHSEDIVSIIQWFAGKQERPNRVFEYSGQDSGQIS
jgi:hypothetical protein